MSKVRRLLCAMYAGPLTPDDISSATGLARCEVVAALRVLEELGIVEPIVLDGGRGAYRLTGLGEKLYRALELVGDLAPEGEAGSGLPQSSPAALAAESASPASSDV